MPGLSEAGVVTDDERAVSHVSQERGTLAILGWHSDLVWCVPKN